MYLGCLKAQIGQQPHLDFAIIRDFTFKKKKKLDPCNSLLLDIRYGSGFSCFQQHPLQERLPLPLVPHEKEKVPQQNTTTQKATCSFWNTKWVVIREKPVGDVQLHGPPCMLGSHHGICKGHELPSTRMLNWFHRSQHNLVPVLAK